MNIKCSHCGQVNTDSEYGYYCEFCGEKLEQKNTCPKCGAILKEGVRFCRVCGTKFEGMTIGNNNVIGGDVISGSKEENKYYGSTTVVKNEDQTKQVRKCHICGSLVPITHGFECPDCGEFTCENCFDMEAGICTTCANQNKQGKENQYKKAFQSAMADGKIEFSERKELFELQKKLGLDSETARRLEEEQKREDEEDVDLTLFEKKVLDESRALFYNEGNVKAALKNLEPLYEKHPYSEEILALYLPCLAKCNSKKAEETIRGLGADILMAYITSADIAIKEKRFDSAEQTLKKASRIWQGNVLVNCYRALFYYALNKRFGDPSFLIQAKQIAENFGEANTELELSYSILINDLLAGDGKYDKSLYDKKYCKENNLYWYVMNSNPLMLNMEKITVGTDSDCDCLTIQEAIDAVAEGGTVYVRPGMYSEDIEFRKVVTLKGCEKDIKDKPSKELPIVVIGNKTCVIDKPVTIEGMLFTHNSNLTFSKLNDEIKSVVSDKDSDEALDNDNPIFVDISSDAVIRNSAFISAANNYVGISAGKPKLEKSYVVHCRGLKCFGKSEATITDIIISGNSDEGLFVTDNAAPKVLDCSIFNNKTNGLNIGGDSAGTFRNCKIHDNKTEGHIYPGVVVFEKANPSLESCEIYNHICYGIWVKDNASGAYKNCKVHDNESTGVYVQDKASPNMNGCEIFNNRGNGLRVSGEAAGIYCNCKIHDNKTEGKTFVGVCIAEQANPSLENCEIYNHLSSGIWVTDNAKGTYKNCKVHDTLEDIGVDVAGKASPNMTGCEIFNNRRNGLRVSGEAAGIYCNCKIHDNKTDGKNYPGVVARGQANPTLENCEIYNHLSYGIWVKDNARGTYKNCTGYNNKNYGIKTSDQAKPSIQNCNIRVS